MEHAAWIELVSAAADDQLHDDERAALDGHLATCAPCRDRLAAFEHQRRALRLAPPSDHGDLLAKVVAARTDDRRRATDLRRTLIARSVAAVAVLVVAIGALAALTVGKAPERRDRSMLASEVVIDADNAAFTTEAVRVKAGTTVGWHNAGATTHQLVRRLGGATVEEELAPGQTESVTFAEPGTYEFYCEIHPGMSGTVTVDA